MNKKDLCVRVARWALFLEEFQYGIEHRPGRCMTHVDALSRSPLPECLMIAEADGGLTARIGRAQAEDDGARRLRDLIARGQAQGYVLRGDLLFRESNGDLQLVVPRRMQTQIIRRAHEQGHFSVSKTENLVKTDYWIPNLRQKIEKVVRNCISCILAERKQGRQECFLHPIDKGNVPLDTLHVDHLGPFPSTRKSYKHVLVVVDAFSKFTWLYATKSTGTQEVLMRLRRQAIIFCNPRRIISDRGTAFTSGDFKEYCREENIERVLVTTGMPRGNGQVERVNRVLVPLLTKLAAPKSEEWHRYVDVAQQCLNTTTSRSIGTSPFHILFGTHPRLKDRPEIKKMLEEEWIQSFQDARSELRIDASRNIAKTQEENKRTFNKKRKRARDYREGNLVAIRRTQQGPGMKLATKYLGPYEICKIMRNQRYLVQKIGEHEGPARTSTAADFMKPWIDRTSDDSSEDEEDEK